MGGVDRRVRIRPKLSSGEVSIFAVMTRLANEHGAINLSQGFPDFPAPEEIKEQMSPAHIAPIVCWLASPESAHVTGRVFDVTGRMLSVSEGWHRGPSLELPPDDVAELGSKVSELVAQARPNANMQGYDEE